MTHDNHRHEGLPTTQDEEKSWQRSWLLSGMVILFFGIAALCTWGLAVSDERPEFEKACRSDGLFTAYRDSELYCVNPDGTIVRQFVD